MYSLIEALHRFLERHLISPLAVVPQVGPDAVPHQGCRDPRVHGIAAADMGPPRIAMSQ